MIPKFLRPERLAFASVEVIPASPRCPWCPGFTPSLDDSGVSHHMCPSCRDRLIFEAMKRRPTPVDVELPEPVDDDDDDRGELSGSTCGANCGYCGRCS